MQWAHIGKGWNIADTTRPAGAVRQDAVSLDNLIIAHMRSERNKIFILLRSEDEYIYF